MTDPALGPEHSVAQGTDPEARPPRSDLKDAVGWIVFGLVIGIIAKLLMPGKDPGGFIITMLLGIAGALVGGFVGRAMGFYGPNQSAGWLVSILGAIILLALYRMLVLRRV